MNNNPKSLRTNCDDQRGLASCGCSASFGATHCLNADCMDVMSKLADKSYDLAICDPPYQVDMSGGKAPKNGFKSREHWDKMKVWDAARPDAAYFDELRRVSKNQIIWGGNYFADMMPASRGWAIWDKVTDGVTCVNPELFYTSFHKACKIFRRPQGLNNGFLNKEGSNIHPTQKPIELYEWLLRQYAEPGQKILDTHMGSGSSVIAAVRGGFEMLACEIDPEYFATAVKRIGRQLQQQTFAMTPND